MSQAIEAVYENGCLRPLKSLALNEGDRVRFRLESSSNEIETTLEVLDDLLDSCEELTQQQWETFDEASARRPLFQERSSE